MRLKKHRRERMAVACSMMACSWAANPDTTARDRPHVDIAWDRFLSAVPQRASAALFDAVKEVDGPHHRFAEMEALLRDGWNPNLRGIR